MRILTTIALLTASGALLAQAPRAAAPPPLAWYYADGAPLPADSLLRRWTSAPDSVRRLVVARPDLACPMPVVIPPDSVELSPLLPTTASRIFQFFREASPPVSGMPTMKSGCYNPLYQPRDTAE